MSGSEYVPELPESSNDFPLGPLGLLGGFRAPDQVRSTLRSIEEYDLSFVERALVHRWDAYVEPNDVATVVRELKRFLALQLLFPVPDELNLETAERDGYVYVPAFQVDLAWHEFILQTAAYRKFCDIHFGKYIDHNPEESRSDARASTAGQIFYHTKRCLQMAFGPTPPFIWGIPTACNCGAICRMPKPVAREDLVRTRGI